MALKGWPYDNLTQLSEDLKANGIALPLSENLDVLKQPLTAGPGNGSQPPGNSAHGGLRRRP